MRPCCIYFNEIKLDDNNKFTLDFSNEEFIKKVVFSTKMTFLLQVLIVI